jgi:SAM-dependent methyltransferase
VLAVDISPTMIERLRARARAEQLESVETRVMDGQALDLPDDSVDVSASQHGVTVFPDLAGGLAEMVRVTRPGGRVLVVAFGPVAKAEFLRLFIGALTAAVPGLPGIPTDPPPPFRLGDRAVFADHLRAAGLTGVKVEAVSSSKRFESVEDYWRTVTSSHPLPAQLAAKARPSQVAEAHRILEGMFRERSGGASAATLSVEINIGTGTA